MEALLEARKEIIGGLVSAAVALPLAMGYGMFAFSSLGEDYFADGAVAGLATAGVVAIVCVLLGEKTTTVYAPRVNSTFFLGVVIYGMIHSDAPAVAAGGIPFVFAIAFSVILLGGVLETLFGLVKLGTLIKFAPQPVMAGFQNAAAALLFLVQLANICGFDHNIPFTQVPQHLAEIKPLSVIIAAITFATMWNAGKLFPKLPPILTAIALGCALYFFCEFIGLGNYLGPVITSVSRPTMGVTAFDYFEGVARGGNFLAFVPKILGGALALAIIASFDALLCAKLVTASGEQRRDGDRLLVRLGLGNVAAACVGGITSGINIGASVTNRTFGARTPLSVLIHAAALLIGAALFPWFGQMPRVVLSAVIMVIAIQHVDLWSLRLASGLRKGSIFNRAHVALDLAVVVVVAVLSIALDIVLAVFIGVAISIALFVLRMSRSVIRRSYRCGAIHSRRSRTAPEYAFLERAGDAILVMELQGALFFGTGEKVLSDVEGALRQQETYCVILDLRRLTEIDSTAASILLELKSSLARQQTEILLAAADQTLATQRLDDFGVLPAIGEENILPDIDRAIERAENGLLRTQPGLYLDEIPLAKIGMLAKFAATELAAIEKHLRRASYRPGDVILREGDPGNELLLVTKGTASAFLQGPNSNIRLASFAPGTVFGELALLDAGARSATVIADEHLICFVLTTAEFASLTEQSPSVAIRLLASIARELSGRLRSANRTIYHLET